MTSPCTTDTQSVDLGEDGSGFLTADVRRDPAGAIGIGANGIKVTLASPAGLEIASNQLRVKVNGPGLLRGANGLQKINSTLLSGSTIAASESTVTQNVGRGATSDIATQMSVNISNTGDQNQAFLIIASWGIDYQTTFSEFETSNIFDSVYVQLQRNLNGAGFVNADYAGLLNFRQSSRVMLRSIERIVLGGGDTQSYAVKPVKAGGTASATAVQGHISGHFGASVLVWW